MIIATTVPIANKRHDVGAVLPNVKKLRFWSSAIFDDKPITFTSVAMSDQYEKGLDEIKRATEDALHDIAVEAAIVVCAPAGQPAHSAVLTISAKGKELSENFSYAEIADSGEAIDAPAAVKVRMLVSRFAG